MRRLVLSVLFVAGCTNARDAAVPLVRAHAARDLRCPTERIEVEPLIGARYEATGCGRTATYYGVCEQISCDVGKSDDQPQPWRDRPDPGSLEAER